MSEQDILRAAVKSTFPKTKFWVDQTVRWGRDTHMLIWVGGPTEEEVCDTLVGKIPPHIIFCCDRVEKV